jgi:hypothetical protein
LFGILSEGGNTQDLKKKKKQLFQVGMKREEAGAVAKSRM